MIIYMYMYICTYTKPRIYTSLVLLVVLHGSETLIMWKIYTAKIQYFHIQVQGMEW